ncbi:unnamed protein product [Trichobilharzia szidati]|nr:unnamed protein product [Trichobilharzia szidati]
MDRTLVALLVFTLAMNNSDFVKCDSAVPDEYTTASPSDGAYVSAEPPESARRPTIGEEINSSKFLFFTKVINSSIPSYIKTLMKQIPTGMPSS